MTSPGGGPSAGNLYADILPDVTGFAAELKTKLGALTLPKVKVAAEPDVTGFNTALRSSLTALPTLSTKVNVRPDLTGFNAAVRAGIAALPAVTTTVNVRVNLTATSAIAELTRLQALANALDGKTISVRVTTPGTAAAISALTRVQAAATAAGLNVRINITVTGNISALAAIATVAAAARGLGALNPTVNIGTGNAVGGMRLLIATVQIFGAAVVPAIAAGTAALASFAGMALSAGAGLGVGILAISGVVGAVKALSDAQNDAAKTGATLARQDKQLASGADQVKSAVAGLANARAQAASQARQSAQQIADAERGLASAQRDALRAQQDLARAREDAIDTYEDLNSAAENNAIAIERANLELQDAEKALQAVRNDPATSRRRIEAELAYREARQQVIDLTTRQGRLAEEQANAAKVGVEGSEQVTAAQDRIRDAQERVADAERALTEARVTAAEQARQSAFSIAQAQQAVVSAQRAAATAAVTAAATSGAAMDTLRQKMDALSPAGQRFAQFLFSQKSALLELRQVAETGVLPGFQRGIEAILPYRPALTGFVRDIATNLGLILERGLKALTQPQWRGFFEYIGATAVPTMNRLATSTGNIALGLANVAVAFAPMQRTVSEGLVNLTQRFENWSATLRTNRSFQDFLDYAITRGPIVLRTLGDLAETILHIAEAAAPVGDVVLTVLSGIAAAVEAIPIPVLTFLIGSLAALRIAGVVAPMVITLGAAMQTAAAGAITMRSAMSSTVAFLGGPWTVAIAAAAVAIGFFIAQSQKHVAEQRRAREANESYAESVARTGQAADEAARKEAAQFVVREGVLAQAERAGVAVDLVTEAYLGEANAMARLNEQLQRRKTQLEAQLVLDAQRHGVESLQYQNTQRQLSATNGLIDTYGKFQGELTDARNAQDLLNKAMEGGVIQVVNLTASERALNDAHRVMRDASASAEQKLNALRTAFEALNKAAEDQIETEERYQRAVLASRDALKENGGTLALNTRAGLDNRDALQERLRASVAMYNADVTAGVQIEEATRRHNDRVTAMTKEVVESGKTKAESDKLRTSVESLVKIYGQVPGNVTTDIKTKGVVEVYQDLINMMIAQKALQDGITPQEAERKYRFLIPQTGTNTSRLATGGPVIGPGGPTEDKVPAYLPTPWGPAPFRLSAGEFVQPTASVDYYGQGFMEALRKRRIPREAIGLATGGAVTWPFIVNVTGADVPTLDEVKAAVVPKGPTVGTGGIGSLDMMRILRVPFPGLALYSGFRPGSRTASGSLSYHALRAADGDAGRAVDLPPRHDVFNFIYENYFAQTRELIWLGQYLKNIHNGRHHVYNRTLLSQHGVAGMPNAHIHWALAKGGLVSQAPKVTVPYLQRDTGGVLPPGLSVVDNSTGRNEWVFNEQQMRTMVGAGSRASRDVHIYPQQVKFGLEDLRAEQARQEALDRIGRPY